MLKHFCSFNLHNKCDLHCRKKEKQQILLSLQVRVVQCIMHVYRTSSQRVLYSEVPLYTEEEGKKERRREKRGKMRGKNPNA